MSKRKIDIDRLAKLAALRLSEEERAAALIDLERIVALVDLVQSVDASGVAPLAHPLDAVQRLRPDAITETVDRARFQAGAPAIRDGLYLAPRALE